MSMDLLSSIKHMLFYLFTSCKRTELNCSQYTTKSTLLSAQLNSKIKAIVIYASYLIEISIFLGSGVLSTDMHANQYSNNFSFLNFK